MEKPSIGAPGIESNRDGRWSYIGFMIPGVVVAHLLLTLFGVGLFLQPPTDYLWPRWQCIFLEGLAVSHIGFAATWLALGRTALFRRFIVGMAVFGFWLTILNYIGLTQEYWMLLLPIQAGGIYSCLIMVVQLLHVRLVGDQRASVRASPKLTLRQLFAWMTAVACFLGLVTLALQSPRISELQQGAFERAIALGTLFVPVMLVLVWAVLGSNRIVFMMLVVVVVVVAAAFCAGSVDQLVRRRWWSSLNPMEYTLACRYWVLLYGAIVLLSLAVIRICGYRLKRSARKRIVPNGG